MRSRYLITAFVGVIVAGVASYSDDTPVRPAQMDLGGRMPGSFGADMAALESALDRIEAETLLGARQAPPDPQGRIRILGKLLLFDRNLSVKRNEACVFCHSPETGFTGSIASLNSTTVSYPGSVRTRFSQRKPQSMAYATFAPVLHYNALQDDLIGGNFWDMRATGNRLQSPAAEQAQGPPTNPVEMGLPDSACLAYRVSQAAYRDLFEKVWGEDSLHIRWPANIEQVCSTPGPPKAADPKPVHISAADRTRADHVFDAFGLAAAAYEASDEVSPFTSKYDYAQAGSIELTAVEKQGYDLFRGKAKCNECHRDGGPGEEPLFTDFTASNLGVPRNGGLQYFYESKAEASGYRPNPDGPVYADPGVGGFVRSLGPGSDWSSLAAKFDGKIKVPTLRNVDKRPAPSFVKAYMHNGYFTSLKEVVHFYNTRDLLPRCAPNDPREKVGCWPVPENSANLNRKQLGNLGLTDQEEDALVAFMTTLTDGYPIPKASH